MPIQTIKNRVWCVCAYEDSRGECPLMNWLENNRKDKTFQAAADGLLALFEHVAEVGPIQLSDKLSHQIDAESKIFEFVKGKLRVPYFLASGKTVICTHGFNKTQDQRTPKAQIRLAIDIRSLVLEELRAK